MNKIDDPKKQALIAVKKAQSHLNKILKMIEDDSYCIDIMVQLSAVEGLLNSASNKLLKNHMRTCFIDGIHIENQDHKEKMIKGLLDVINLYKK